MTELFPSDAFQIRLAMIGCVYWGKPQELKTLMISMRKSRGPHYNHYDLVHFTFFLEEENEFVIYDNGFDQEIGGGNIKVHEGY